MTSELNNLKRGEREVVITEHCAVTVERTSRGSFATVTDAGSEFDGQYAFSCTPATAFGILMTKLAAQAVAAR